VAKYRFGQTLYLIVILFVLSACTLQPAHDSGPAVSQSTAMTLPDDAIPRDEPRSRHGNGPYYNVNGETYEVLKTDYGYRERGVASWYGKKFHGQLTSNQERYNMYAMTAAHKSLPLPSYVRVRNLKNGKSVVVRVNDRGPFVDNRLIDLSYSAAVKLDMITAGTGLVEVTAISFDEPPAPQPADPVIVDNPATDTAEYIFVQVGAFGEPENARRRFSMLRDVGIDRAFPIADVLQYDSIVDQLQRIGISETHLVTE
jgi:rare lipoprotein A